VRTEKKLCLQPDQVNAVLLTTYESAYDKAKRADRQNLSESEKQDVMFSVQRLPGCESLTWDALKMRISRMRDRGQTERKEGSGRKQIWTPEMADLAKTISREHNYEISRTDIYYEMVSRWTSAGAKRPPLQRARVCPATMLRGFVLNARSISARMMIEADICVLPAINRLHGVDLVKWAVIWFSVTVTAMVFFTKNA
jgi:hypothetical protein